MASSPDDTETLKAELARARAADDAATIARQNLEIAKLRRSSTVLAQSARPACSIRWS